MIRQVLGCDCLTVIALEFPTGNGKNVNHCRNATLLTASTDKPDWFTRTILLKALNTYWPMPAGATLAPPTWMVALQRTE